jgi:hypothetical protein
MLFRKNKNTFLNYMKNIKIIVSRYNEDIEWTNNFKKNIILYNKGNELPSEYNSIILPNVGREGHTYYYHIYNNYDNLADYNIFLQGNPFDHSPHIIDDIKNILNDENLELSFKFLSNIVISCNLYFCNYHHNLPLREVYNKIFNINISNKNIEFGVGAQFIVSKETILKNSKEFYYNIIKLLDYSVNPIEGYVIERFHKTIFSFNSKIIDRFDIDVYKELNNDLKYLSDESLLNHYFEHGFNEKRLCNLPNNFDLDAYRELNEDLKYLSNYEIKKHFFEYGLNEGRQYNYNLPDSFDLEAYRELNEDLKYLSNSKIKKHFFEYGLNEGRHFNYNLPDNFDLNKYRELNEDLRYLSDTELKKHFFEYGQIESRNYS